MNTEEIELLNQIGFPGRLFEFPRWHLLELISDGREEGKCRLCHQSGLGPTYKCGEGYCDFLLHKSCVEQPHIPDMKHEHHIRVGVQHIIFIKELENEEKVICSFCEEPVLGSVYKCSIPTCSFLIHQSCANVPVLLHNHPTDTAHGLALRVSFEDQYCDLCGKLINGRFSYRCEDCYLAIHVKCAPRGLVDVRNCHQHDFQPLRKNVGQLACHACGFQNVEPIYLCRNCGLLIHSRCAKMYLRNIKTKECNHALTCSFSLHLRELKCKVCKGLIDNRYAAYYCVICDYVVHLECTYAILDQKASLQMIEKHFSHPEHKLILSHEQPEYDQHCKVCMDQIISPPFYSCAPCKFFLHERCGELPLKIRQQVNHWHPLTLDPSAPSTGQKCNSCGRNCFGFTYRCDRCPGRIWDIQCGLLQQDLKHEGHQHNLFDTVIKGNCKACNKDGWQFLRCAMCNFNLCHICATYPLQTRHRNDEHPLNLTYKVEDDSKEYYCLICEQTRNSLDWFYYCKECDFAAHIKCAYSRMPPIDYISRSFVK